MKQGDERTIQVKREMIVGMMTVPLFAGFMLAMNAIDDPGLHGIRGVEVLRLCTIGFSAGVCFSGLVLFLRSKAQRG